MRWLVKGKELRVKTSLASDRGFHITIGAHPSGRISLEQDLRLVKAALLYADNVKLYSPTASMMSMVLALEDTTPEQQLRFVEILIPHICSRRESRKLLGQLRRYGTDPTFRPHLRGVVAEQWNMVRQEAISVSRDAGFDNLVRAVEAGVLELHTFEGADDSSHILDFMIDCVAQAAGSPLLGLRAEGMSKRDEKLVREFVEGVSDAVSDGTTYPLFDTATGSLVDESIREGKLSVSKAGMSRGKHTALAGHLLRRLPLFDHASVDEILDVREELDPYLARFRKAMIEYAETVEAASWDADFPVEAEKVFYRDVVPAVLDIEEAVRSNKYLASLVRKFVDKPLVLPSGTALSLVLSQFDALPDAIVKSLGITAASAAIAFDTYNDWRQRQKEIEKNALYFYYEAGEQLRSQ